MSSEIATPADRVARKAALNAIGDLRNNIAPALSKGKKLKRWSHQDELSTLKGRSVVLSIGGYAKTGLLIEADQFSLKFRAEGQQSTVTYFKHAIDYYAAA